MRKVQLAVGEYYHIYNRGVEKRDIFVKDGDFLRFLLGMREFNDKNKKKNFGRMLVRSNMCGSLEPQQPLVEFVAYSLLPNHFHFILSQVVEDGISKFMQKLCGGYTNYFNKKYQRTGVLFQGPFHAVHIQNNTYLLHLSRYIHLNPLDLFDPKWREGITDFEKDYKFLLNYKWSSLPFFMDNKKPSLIKLSHEIISGQFKSIEFYMNFLKDWVGRDLEFISPLIIEKYKDLAALRGVKLGPG